MGWRMIGKLKRLGSPKDTVPKVVRLIRSSESEDFRTSYTYASQDQSHPHAFDLKSHNLLSQGMNEIETFDAVSSFGMAGSGEKRRAWTYKSI